MLFLSQASHITTPIPTLHHAMLIISLLYVKGQFCNCLSNSLKAAESFSSFSKECLNFVLLEQNVLIEQNVMARQDKQSNTHRLMIFEHLWVERDPKFSFCNIHLLHFSREENTSDYGCPIYIFKLYLIQQLNSAINCLVGTSVY